MKENLRTGNEKFCFLPSPIAGIILAVRLEGKNNSEDHTAIGWFTTKAGQDLILGCHFSTWQKYRLPSRAPAPNALGPCLE